MPVVTPILSPSAIHCNGTPVSRFTASEISSMKFPTSLALLAGFAGGVLATALVGRLIAPRGEGPQPAAVMTGPAEPESSPGPSLVGKAPPDAGDASLLKAEPGGNETAVAGEKKRDALKAQREWQERWQEQVRKRTAEENRIRLVYLADALGLTPAQMATLEQALATGNPSALAPGARTADPIDTALSAILTPEQAQAYEGLKEKERADRIEARAMQRFAALPGTLNLTDDQKDKVFEVFASEEAGRLDNQSAAGADVLRVMTNSSGGVLSESVVVDLSEAVVAVSASSGADPQAVARNAGQSMQERIARSNQERIEALRPLLTERQIEAYRSHLEAGNRVFGGNLQIEVSAGNPSPQEEAAK